MIVTCRSVDGGVDIIEGMIFVFLHLGFLGTIYVEAQAKQRLIPHRLINFLLNRSTILPLKQGAHNMRNPDIKRNLNK